MLRKLKTKFLLAAIVALIIVLTVIIGTINFLNYRSIVSDADFTLKILMDNSGRFPNKPGMMKPDFNIHITPETPFESRFFTVIYKNGELESVDTASIAAINDETAILMAKTVISSKITKGFWGNYRFLSATRGDKTSVIFLDCTKSLDAANTFLIVSVIISILGIIAVFLLLWIISARIVKPIIDGYDKQKEFITNAGHDIKTPLTIIDADAELLEMELGDNEWLSDIRKQTARMTSLTNDLIYLSRMEEKELSPHIEFSLTDVAEEAISSFAAPARTKSIAIESDIPRAITYKGDEESIRKLLSLLLDNAVKYSPDGERICVSVKRQGLWVSIKISNVAPNITEDTVKRMFDRFYRSDSSRSSGGGFGIGLSVASAIVASHKGRISANKNGDLLIVEAILS